MFCVVRFCIVLCVVNFVGIKFSDFIKFLIHDNLLTFRRGV